ncbi:anti-sigma factor [Streptomyces sp. NPDC020490]|uniref:anti-sigma factor n=1 Tax=Streptomyces sp. NPDC020490 TaxID=3365078 RepID=UPI0037A0A11F
MKHTDEETLALMALGEVTSPSATAHLHECLRCRKELDSLRRVVSAMRTPVPAEHELLQPPDGLWNSIADELNIPTRHGPAATPPAPGAAEPARRAGLRRLGRFTVVLAACAALLGAAAGSTVTWWVTQTSSPGATPATDGRRLASLQARAAGYARLTADSRGHRTLDITVKGLPTTVGYFEVWLMDRTHTALVSMGVLGPDGHATLPVPDNIDLREYSVVDVSVQSYNGKPDHSGDSVVRGPYAG